MGKSPRKPPESVWSAHKRRLSPGQFARLKVDERRMHALEQRPGACRWPTVLPSRYRHRQHAGESRSSARIFTGRSGKHRPPAPGSWCQSRVKTRREFGHHIASGARKNVVAVGGRMDDARFEIT